MNRVVSTLVMAFAGAAAASILTTWRRHQIELKDQHKEAIQRWEDDGGRLPAPGSEPVRERVSH